ncbi:hypothetical protein G7Y89_g14710 [Cudoniella acicularis]|uniref:Rhodopsin domain-containing protein n=1 Tax=Cudoniella acicularis TaxID=354080 RepID=A0A8H4VS60_9HELO|nr:hypothetical protein G7Y89_g14710 [Cudoniella acicularis]
MLPRSTLLEPRLPHSADTATSISRRNLPTTSVSHSGSTSSRSVLRDCNPHLTRRRALAATALLACIRLKYAAELDNNADFSWNDQGSFIWTTVQVSFSVACACVPAMAPLLRAIKKKTATRRGYDNSNSGSRTFQSARAGMPRNKFSSLGVGTDTIDEIVTDTESTKKLNPMDDLENWTYKSTIESDFTGGGRFATDKGKNGIPLQNIGVRKEVTVNREGV